MKFVWNVKKQTKRNIIQNHDVRKNLEVRTSKEKLIKLSIFCYGHVLHINDISILLRA